MRVAVRCAVLAATFVLPAGAAAAEIRPTLVDAQAQFEQTHYEQALKLYKQADAAEPGHPAVEYNIGLCHLNLGDGEKAMQRFESVASRAHVNGSLRSDAFYNVGFIRASDARRRLRELLAPATQPAEQIPPEAPANIEQLRGIADELLRAITAFKQSREIEPADQTDHNIRAARITRRNVLGLLRRALETKEKQDILKDPRAYLEALIFEQDRQVSLTRYLILNPPEEPAQARSARRAAVRLQRRIMESTGTFADELSQFREGASDQDPSSPATQPAQETPREKVYHAAARQIESAVEAQRDACAHLLDGEIRPACEKQFAAVEAMYAALYLFPLDPPRALVKARGEQAQLKELVATIEADEHWLRDPLLAEARIPAGASWEPDKTAIYYRQFQVGNLLSILRLQCRHIAATSRPADTPGAPPGQENPLLDPELNARLAEVLDQVESLRTECLEAITARDKDATLAVQDKLLEVIDAALELLPKTIEQRIAELIVRQGRLNAQVKAEAGEVDPDTADEGLSALDKVRKWAARLKSKLIGDPPAKVAETLRGQQKDIQAETAAVGQDVRHQIPAGTATQPGSASPPPAGQPPQVQAYIEAGKHLADADAEMTAAVEGLDRAVIEDSLKPMGADGPVQKPQAKALEELVKALAALRPPTTQPHDDQQEQKDQQQDQQQQQADQDVQRQVDRLDNERERAQRELYQKRPRTVIKDW